MHAAIMYIGVLINELTSSRKTKSAILGKSVYSTCIDHPKLKGKAILLINKKQKYFLQNP